jgi:hypothetical protein
MREVLRACIALFVGRFVYQLSDGRVDEGRRPEARAEWSDVDQVIGERSLTSPQ